MLSESSAILVRIESRDAGCKNAQFVHEHKSRCIWRNLGENLLYPDSHSVGGVHS